MAPIASPRIVRGRRISRTMVWCTSLPLPKRASMTAKRRHPHRPDAKGAERQQRYQCGKAGKHDNPTHLGSPASPCGVKPAYTAGPVVPKLKTS